MDATSAVDISQQQQQQSKGKTSEHVSERSQALFMVMGALTFSVLCRAATDTQLDRQYRQTSIQVICTTISPFSPV